MLTQSDISPDNVRIKRVPKASCRYLNKSWIKQRIWYCKVYIPDTATEKCISVSLTQIHCDKISAWMSCSAYPARCDILIVSSLKISSSLNECLKAP